VSECFREHGVSTSSACRSWVARDMMKMRWVECDRRKQFAVNLWSESAKRWIYWRTEIGFDRLRKACGRSWPAAEVSPCHAGYAYDNLATTVAWKTVCRASFGRPLCRRVRNANNDCAQDTRRWLTCCPTEKFLFIVTPSALISSILGIVDAAGDGIAVLMTQKRSPSTWRDSGEIYLSQSSHRHVWFLLHTTHDPRFDDAWLQCTLAS